MNNDIDKIETQYNEHPYPLPIDDMQERIADGYIQGSCPEFFWQRIFPEKQYKDDLNVLIAGCGTNQAIYHALKFPNSRHYAIDLSEKSLKHVFPYEIIYRAYLIHYLLLNSKCQKLNLYMEIEFFPISNRQYLLTK